MYIRGFVETSVVAGGFRSERLDQLEHLAVDLVALEVFVLDVLAAGVEGAEVAPEIPEGPAPAGVFPELEVVPHPRDGDVVRGAVVAAPLADVHAAAAGLQGF